MRKIILEDIERILSSDIDWNVFQNKTVLITGANGMLPSYMVEVLLTLNRKYDFNIKVLALVRNLKRALNCFNGYTEKDGLYYIVQDVSTPIMYASPIHYIVHAASQASPLYYGTDPVGTLNANIMGTHTLLELAVKKTTESFLFFSTGGVYGDMSDNTLPIKEDMCGYLNPLKVRSCYFESKRMGENMCVSYSYQYGIKTSIVRVFHTLGPNINLSDGRAFSDFCKCIVENRDIVLRSDGCAKRSFCYVSDAVVAYFKILLNGEDRQAYNVGGGIKEEISMCDLAKNLIALYPQKHLKVIYDIDLNNVTYGKMKSPIMRVLPDLEKIEKLGWSQQIPVLEAFQRTIGAILDSE